MAANPVMKLNELYLEFRAGKLDRRQFMWQASALGLSAASLSFIFRTLPAAAQEPVFPGGYKSITIDEYKAQLAEAFPFTRDPQAAKVGGIVIMGEIASANLTTTNLLLAGDAPTLPVMGLCQEFLVGSSPVDGQYVPALVDHWEIAEDGRTYTFYLRQDKTWHDGTPFTADDVIFSFDAQRDETTGSSYTASFNNAVESYRKIDDHTVEVVAVDVFAQVVFLGNSLCAIVPKHIWEGVPYDQWRSDPGATGQDPSRVIGTGPFKFEGINEAEGTTTFVRNENDPDAPPIIDRFIFQTWPDEIAAVEALRAGQIDFFENVPPPDVESLMAEPDLEVSLYDTYSFSWYGYNLDPEKTTLFQDREVRQALFYALDRQSMVDNFLLGYGEVAHGTQPVLSIAYAPDRITTKYDYDPDKARELLAAAGWVDSDGDGIVEKDGQKLSFEMMYPSGVPTWDQVAAYMQQTWKEIGAEGRPNPVDFGTVLVPALTENFNFDICMLGFSWDITGDQSAMFGTEYYKTGFNAMRYSNPEVDRLFAAANRELDPEKRRELLIEASNLINEDLPVGILWFRKDRTAYNVRLHNFTPNANGGLLWSLPWVWVE